MSSNRAKLSAIGLSRHGLASRFFLLQMQTKTLPPFLKQASLLKACTPLRSSSQHLHAVLKHKLEHLDAANTKLPSVGD